MLQKTFHQAMGDEVKSERVDFPYRFHIVRQRAVKLRQSLLSTPYQLILFSSSDGAKLPARAMMTEPEATLDPQFLSPADASALFEALVREVEWDERMKARKTACFGQTYDDSGVDYQLVPMHPLLVPLCDAIAARLGFVPTNCLLNYHETGRSSMGFHSDATHNLAEGTGVAIVSIGAERSLTFRSKADPAVTVDYPLPHGSLFYMSQGTQDHWLHAVKKAETDDSRISLTFRHILTPEELAVKGK